MQEFSLIVKLFPSAINNMYMVLQLEMYAYAWSQPCKFFFKLCNK